MTGPWNVEGVPWIGFYRVWRETPGGKIIFARRQRADLPNPVWTYAWTTRESAERAAARLNRKYEHKCPGLYDCNLHPVPHVGRSRLGRGWYGGRLDRFSTYPTHDEAFASSLEYAKETTDD